MVILQNVKCAWDYTIINLKFCFWSFFEPSLDGWHVAHIFNDFLHVWTFFSQIETNHKVQVVQESDE